MMLKKIADAAAIFDLLVSAKDLQSDVFVWRLVAGEEHLAQVKIESVNKTRRDLSIVPNHSHEVSLQTLLMNQSTIDLYIPHSSLLFRCRVKSSEGSLRYSLHFPVEVAQVDRRNSSRINTYEKEDLEISFSSQTERGRTQQFMKSCFDISGGGLSFYVSKMEKSFFREGELLSELKIKTPKWDSKVNAEMVMIKEIDPNEFNNLPYKVWRVCCRFKEIDELSKHQLDKYILEKIKDELHVINS